MDTSANTPASEDPLPERIMLCNADLTQRPFAKVLNQQNECEIFHSPIVIDCAIEYGGFCQKILPPVKTIPKYQSFPRISISNFKPLNWLIYNQIRALRGDI